MNLVSLCFSNGFSFVLKIDLPGSSSLAGSLFSCFDFSASFPGSEKARKLVVERCWDLDW